jgi:DNA (cytosine-5)-methyltransferase 1
MHSGTSLTDAIRTLWRTPDSPNAGGPRNRQTSRGHGHQITIAEQAEHWPTPNVPNGGRTTATSNYREDGSKRQIYLGALAEHWPTPAARDWKDTPGMATTAINPDGSVRNRDDQLARAVHQWPTPTAEPYGSSQNGINGIGGTHERPSANTPSLDRMSRSFPLDPPTSRRGDESSAPDPTSRPLWTLNPQFVEWLMGFPIGWTAFAPVATEWSLYKQRMRFAFWQCVQE